MRGGLDETLARMARREEALRRRAAEEETAAPPGAAGAPDPAATATGGVPTVGAAPGTGRNAGPGWADGRPVEPARQPADPGHLADPAGPAAGLHRADDTRWRDPVEQVAEVVRRVVAEHPGMAVSVRIEQDGQAYPLRVSWSGGIVMVTAPEATAPPPVWPMSVKTVSAWTPRDGSDADPAARLAEMIRQDPSLLAGEQGG
ncbi:hypothetical protein [Micromonospora endolithica]|uniref:Uncharacterized protein n=1 Tax=Micromonospora endolithica TaxID=230091 RepID=A0A3A9YSY7_9ACTN|nr:hypothetical protein [Micromonospora endolithica]RKN38929.1 hypothetical protein D7223_30270 [Micromonospora endolithica]